jgi:hypothetical protein
MRRVALCVGICAGLAAAPLSGQRVDRLLLRLEAGSLNPDGLFETTLAVGATAGWQLSGPDALLLRYLRQSQNSAGTDVGQRSWDFLTANWEHAFGEGGLYRRQVLVRVGGGAVFRYLLRTAPVVDGGLEVRYGLARRWALLANIEDDLAVLPHQVIQVCSFGFCSLVTFDSKIEHNFGLIIAGEWRP